MKKLLKKSVGTYLLTYEELNTILAEVEAALNSQYLTGTEHTSPGGSTSFTPDHLLIGCCYMLCLF